jgi:hypothetical protein
MTLARRDFLTTALAAAFSLQRPKPSQAQMRSGKRATPLVILFDERLPESRALASGARMTGASAVPLRGDIGLLWYERLMPAQGVAPVTFAGLTRHAEAFLLARLAHSVGMHMTRESAQTLILWRLDPPRSANVDVDANTNVRAIYKESRS